MSLCFKNCLCNAITEIDNKTQIIILQHPSEVKHAKNTVKALKVMLNNIHIFVGETSEDFLSVKKILEEDQSKAILVFPLKNSITVNLSEGQNQCNQVPKMIILIDGSWRKAKKILYLNPWLLNLTAIEFEGITSGYLIRKARQRHSLSTLESAAYCLHIFEQIPLNPFRRAQETLMQNQFKYMCSSVLYRYKK